MPTNTGDMPWKKKIEQLFLYYYFFKWQWQWSPPVFLQFYQPEVQSEFCVCKDSAP